MASIEDLKIEDIPVDDIDFSDLEREFQFNDGGVNFDNFLVVDGAPVAAESKVPVLQKVLSKLFSQAGNVVDIQIPVEDGKTKGHLFIEMESVPAAKEAIKLFNGKKLDAKHRLLVNSLNDMEKYGSDDFDSQSHEPVVPEFAPTDFLRSWLQNKDGRDQFILQKGEMTRVFWNRLAHQPDGVCEARKNWSNDVVKFSPKGTYLLSFHDQGVTSWGGPNFERLKRFYHPDVSRLDVSPTEKFLVTFSMNPIKPTEDSPFSAESEGHQICVWDLATGFLMKTFGIPPNAMLQWPLIRFSYDDKYCGRLGPNALALYDIENNFQLLDGKLHKVEGIQDFSFAPKAVQLTYNRRKSDPVPLLAYWTPETNNQSCKAFLMTIPNKRIVKTVNLVQVSNVVIHWHPQADFVCFQVDRHTKSKKTFFTNLEICKLTESEIPVEKIEMKDRVLELGWEPKGDRFVVISKMDNGGEENPMYPKNFVKFFAPEKKENKDKDLAVLPEQLRWKLVKTVDQQFSNCISWSPAGRFVAVCTIVNGKEIRKASLDFYDFDFTGEKTLNEVKEVKASLQIVSHIDNQFFTDLEWDSSGRFLTAWSSYSKHKLENGYTVYNCCGEAVRKEIVDEFRNFVWRPRPDTLLSNSEKKKARKNLKQWSVKFEEQDAMESDSALRDLILKRRAELSAWVSYREEAEERLQSEDNYTIFNDFTQDEGDETQYVTVEEVKEEILEESQEEVESFE
ncbi:unnamed protein product [Kluyveromyces dobzhanskii CBS 2104]|uniref:Eukaryotic translation initiation factor 3 subunit B n=1 Tax=Kluyveromyces dobzhanskii CBS 2104 TaxID=1427455 RepID=A0A0A8L855_9SACH|nr:unnamed protein product [Kluyveromyces dobzhanskii CBS 2104]